MMVNNLKTLFVIIFVIIFTHTTYASDLSALTTPTQNEAFRNLKIASQKRDITKAKKLASLLANYPIPSYVEYYRLKADFSNVTQTDIDSFSERFPETAISDRLRNDWLLQLGKLHKWDEFDENFPKFKLQDDTQVQCYNLTSRALKGENVAEQAKQVLINPAKYGNACTQLISVLAEKQQFSKTDVWLLAQLAVTRNYTNLAAKIASINGVEQNDVQQSFNNILSNILIDEKADDNTREMYLLSLGKLAKKDFELAASLLANNLNTLNVQQQQSGWALIALPASMELSPFALDYWKKAGDTPLTALSHEWRIRAALRSNQWALVEQWIDQMPAYQRKQPTWLYWKARALEQIGENSRANKYYRYLSKQFGFYALLAREAIGETIQAPINREHVTQDEITAISNNSGIELARLFFSMNWRFEGIREWNWQLRKMSDRQLLAAGEYARELGLLDRMINTSERTQSEHDFSQRYPMPYKENLEKATNELGLDMAWAYGIIRQESRFVHVAKSHVGAAGLMQVMPETAKLVAKRIGLTEYHPGQINSIDTNIILGTNYLSMVLTNLDGSEPLATAAYNAGPGRPKRWRNCLEMPVDGDVFVETIPFTETREYVKNVLSNASYYAVIIGNGQTSLKTRLGMIHTKKSNPSYNDKDDKDIKI